MSDDTNDELPPKPDASEEPKPAPKKKKKRRPAPAAATGEAAERAATSEREPPAKPAGEPFRPGALRALLGLLAVGAAVAVYMTVAHLELFHGTGSFKSICNFGPHLSCDAVNTSDESEIGGVAIAVFALPAYAALAFLAARALRAPAGQRRAPLALAHALSWPMVAYSAYLLAVMVFKLGTLCLFCLTLDAVNVSALVLTAWSIGARPTALLAEAPTALRAEPRGVTAPALGAFAVALGIGLGGHAWLRSSLEADARAAVLAAAEPAASTGTPGAGPTAAAAGEEPDGDGTPQGKKLPTRRWPVPIDDEDATVGPKDAKVVVVQFADFQCGYCKKLEHAMAAVRAKYAAEVRFVFKHFPMNPRCSRAVKNEKHKHACEAAVSAECARRQGKFWPMHDLLYKNQHRLDRPDLDHYAQLAGLDAAAYSACMSDPSALESVMKDTDDGAGVKVAATPRTFINGRLFGGALSEDVLSFVIDIELGRVTGPAAEAYVAPSAAPSATGTAAAVAPVEVRHGDLRVAVDPFEASIDASGKAVSVPGAVPAEVEHADARKACELAGKRLCTSEEWVSACQGAAAVDDDGNGDFADDYIEGNQYPYANWYEPGVCRDAGGSVGRTGTQPGCKTASGIFDMAGNVAEWVGASPERAVLLGGGAGDKEKAACYRPKRREGAGARGGFRCCADLKP